MIDSFCGRMQKRTAKLKKMPTIVGLSAETLITVTLSTTTNDAIPR